MLRAKKSLSQNFLIDKNVCIKILNHCKIKNNTVLEIGPGYGFMTDFILKNNPKKLYLVEKDIHLLKFLNEKYKGKENVKIIGEDILKFDLKSFKNLIVVSNLPYNISTKIILYLFNFNKNISEMTFMIQKEVALKLDYSLPNMNKYKFLTKIVSSYTLCFHVSSNVFLPKPKVTSSVVKFNLLKNVEINKAKKFSKQLFKNIRKKISNNIKLRKKTPLLDKRVNELTIEDLLIIYNLF